MKPSTRAFKYAEDITTGKVPANKWVRLACQRFINDLARSKTTAWPYKFDENIANRAVGFMEKLPHVKGKWAAKSELLKFEPWQCFIECNLFGWVHKQTGLRRFREAFELEPRKNAKSTRAAARGLYLLTADGEAGAEIYAGATTERQAYEIFKPAWLMASKTEELVDHFGLDLTGNAKNPGAIFVMKDMSKFETMIGKPGDGSSPHGALVDEYHEHDDNHMVDAMQTGMGAREQPLLSIVSTAGSNLSGPCFERQIEMQRLLDGVTEDDRIFAIIYGLDEGDRWDDPANLRKANPNFGVSVYEDYLLAQLGEARRSASKQNAFRTKHLNEWVGAKTAWMNMVAWHKQRREMTMDDFLGCACRVSADMSSRKDVTAVDVTFERGNEYFSFKKFFVPEAAAEENEKYREFITAGVLETTPGAQVDQEAIEEYIKTIGAKFKVIDFSFDEWQAEYMMTRLSKLGVEVIKYPFRGQHVSEPMKWMEAMILSGRYFHDGNPMMTWMMTNVAARIDTRGNIFPNKARQHDEKCKIDGIAVSIMSLGRFLVNPVEKEYQIIFI